MNWKKVKSRLVIILAIVIILPIGWLLFLRMEGEKPDLEIDLAAEYIHAGQDLSLHVADIKSGVRHVILTMIQESKEVVLIDERFPALNIFQGGEVHEKTIALRIQPKKIGITEGKAVLRATARDYSWRQWGKGLKHTVEKEVIVDTQPPAIGVLSKNHNFMQGGSGLVIYKLSEPCPESGVHVGDHFYPGYSGLFKDPRIHSAFLALTYDQGKGVEITVTAVDKAGNTAKSGFPHYVQNREFKKDVINITDNFLNWKMPEFDIETPENSADPHLDKFLMINEKLRAINYRNIVEHTRTPDTVIYWEGAFSRLPNSARKASFADQREYRYQGQVIDHQVHMGIDLASVAHAPVPAANKGKIAFTGSVGIYGLTVLIDHGFGLYSMYSHLSQSNVQEGQMVEKDEIVGRTGTTGLAAGDHLHFSIVVHDTYVNPVEWWDQNWIRNNITSKIEDIRVRFD